MMLDNHERCPPSVVTDNNDTLMKKLVIQNHCITVKHLSSETGMSVRSIELILHDNLNINKVSARLTWPFE